MEDYKANSHRSKEEQKKADKKKIDPVVTGKVTTKKNVGRKLSDTFLSEDVHNVKSYIIFDVVVPAIKKTISDIIINTVEMTFGGGSYRDRRSSNVSTVSYRNYSDISRDRDDRRYSSNMTRTGYSYDDVIFPTRSEAEKVLDAMDDIIDRYDVVSVSDLYELVGEEGRIRFTDNKYGWANISRAEIVRCRDGYYIKFPKATPID